MWLKDEVVNERQSHIKQT